MWYECQGDYLPSKSYIYVFIIRWSLAFGFIRLVCEDSCRSLTFNNQIHGINYGVCTNFKLKNKKKTSWSRRIEYVWNRWFFHFVLLSLKIMWGISIKIDWSWYSYHQVYIDYIHVGLLFTVFELAIGLKYDKNLHDGDCTFRCRSTHY